MFYGAQRHCTYCVEEQLPELHEALSLNSKPGGSAWTTTLPVLKQCLQHAEAHAAHAFLLVHPPSSL